MQGFREVESGEIRVRDRRYFSVENLIGAGRNFRGRFGHKSVASKLWGVFWPIGQFTLVGGHRGLVDSAQTLSRFLSVY